MKGYDKAAAKSLLRSFVEASGRVDVKEERIMVRLDRPSNDPIPREAELAREVSPISWWTSPRLVDTQLTV